MRGAKMASDDDQQQEERQAADGEGLVPEAMPEARGRPALEAVARRRCPSAPGVRRVGQPDQGILGWSRGRARLMRGGSWG